MRTRSHHRRNSSGGDVLEGKLLGDYSSFDDSDSDNAKGSRRGGGLRGDYGSIALLLLLYTLQGVPMGLSASVSFILQEKGASYAEQGIFSLASWPFSLKILWAPIVDSVYFRSVGQRRSWLLPLQVLVGLTLSLAGNLGALISDKGSDVRTLAGVFFWIYALLASQDIAVDGWALTMLPDATSASRPPVTPSGKPPVSSSPSPDFWSSTPAEASASEDSSPSGASSSSAAPSSSFSSASAGWAPRRRRMAHAITVVDAYRQAASIARLPAVIKLSAILLTRAIAFSAAETLTQLKLLERGVPKQHMATISALMTPVSVLLPVYVSRWTGGSRPLDCVTSTWMWRAIAALGASAVVLCVPEGVSEGPVPWGYYACLYLWLSLYAGLNTVHFVSFMAFYSRVSDETMGGTYMTLLNTVSNLGFKWCETAAMFAVDLASPKRCEGGDSRRERRARRRRRRTSASRAADDASTATGRSTCSWGCRRSSRTSGSRSPPSTWTDCRREGWPSGKCERARGGERAPKPARRYRSAFVV